MCLSAVWCCGLDSLQWMSNVKKQVRRYTLPTKVIIILFLYYENKINTAITGETLKSLSAVSLCLTWFDMDVWSESLNN